MSKPTAIIVCPGRGTYNKEELGYLSRFHASRNDVLAAWDEHRSSKGHAGLLELDRASTFSNDLHTRGNNAAPLIFASAYFDFLSLIESETLDVLAVTGNSMGWYIALACSGCLSSYDAFNIVETMGVLTHEAMSGGQTIYPYFDDEWQPVPRLREQLFQYADEIPNLYVSIHIGGMIVFAGSLEALNEVEKRLKPVGGRFPMRLVNHAAFHTPLQNDVSTKARNLFKADFFHTPTLPLIDGRGHIWIPGASDPDAIQAYTFGHQVVETYDFSKAIRTAMHEFAPDLIIALGPGRTLGGSIGQCLADLHWLGIASKSDFEAQQKSDPLLYLMGMKTDRNRLLKHDV